jgi:nitroimidazol reductase NimA-like FMN-containing flavoprotein (pyridoxamine 5'-phosphate oxidase superfamily)
VNIGTSQKRLRAEIIEFIQRHEDAVLAQLRTHESAVIPTSFGEITLNLADLHEAVA